MHNPGSHVIHESALVHLDGADFFVDSADPEIHDGRIGQMLCGWAWDRGAREIPIFVPWVPQYECGGFTRP